MSKEASRQKSNANLIPFRDSATAREAGRRGGLKTAKTIRQKKDMRMRLQLLLECQCPDGQEVADAVCNALIEQALKGDVRAYEVIRDTLGEKPVARLQAETDQTLRIIWAGEDQPGGKND